MKKLKYFYLIILSPLFFSCEEVIELDTPNGAPKVVIEAQLSDQPNGCVVKISTTVNISQPNNFPSVENAVVTITDGDGNIFNLENGGSGLYINQNLIGEYNKQYYLKVNIDGTIYEASSTMPQPVSIDSLAINEFAFFGNSTKLIDIYLNDPIDQENYYKFIPYVNDKKYFNLEILDDQFTNGQPIDYSIFVQDYELVVGDSVRIEIWNTDKRVYDYFDSLGDVIDGGSQTAAPANPNTNLSNDALGYFSAHTVQNIGIRVDL